MEDRNYVLDYMDELKAIQPCTEQEEALLIRSLQRGDDSAMERLIEGSLHTVFDMAQSRFGQGASMGDLIQEGNMALVEAIDGYRTSGIRIEADSFHSYLIRRIEEAMDQLNREETDSRNITNQMAENANRLLLVTAELEEELGREATLPELAKKMGISEDMVERIIRESQSALDLGDVSGDPEDAAAETEDYDEYGAVRGPEHEGYYGIDSRDPYETGSFDEGSYAGDAYGGQEDAPEKREKDRPSNPFTEGWDF